MKYYYLYTIDFYIRLFFEFLLENQKNIYYATLKNAISHQIQLYTNYLPKNQI